MYWKFMVFMVLIVGVCSDKKYIPPDPQNKPLMARYVVHSVDWMTIGTISTLTNFKGYPFVNVNAVADGPAGNGTGIPYLLITDLDLSGRDLKVNNKICLLSTLAEVGYCKTRSYDSQDPRCPRVILNGKLVKVAKDTKEYKFAHSALVSRHPIIPLWEITHPFYVAKIDLEQVVLLDAFGGPSFIKIDDYLNVDPQQVRDHAEIDVKLV